MSTVLLIEPLLTSVLAVRRDSMGTCRPSAGIHLLGLARRSGSCRSCRSEPVSPVSVPLGTDADCGPLVTLRPFARPAFRPVSTLLRPLLTPGTLSRVRSPRVRTDTFDPCRQALPDTSFGDGWISRSLARSSPVPGLTACSCSCGRVLATPFFQLGLAASTLGFATLLVTLRGYLLSGNKYMPMSGTLGRAPGARGKAREGEGSVAAWPTGAGGAERAASFGMAACRNGSPRQGWHWIGLPVGLLSPPARLSGRASDRVGGERGASRTRSTREQPKLRRPKGGATVKPK